jgi:hypothetical protein
MQFWSPKIQNNAVSETENVSPIQLTLACKLKFSHI